MARRASVRRCAQPAALRGFTLIELLAAISILAVVAALSWRGLDTIVRTRVALTSALEQTRGMQLAFAQMQSDCGNIASIDEIGSRPRLQAEPGRLTMLRVVLIENQPSRAQVIAYRLRDGILSRHESEATRDLRVLDELWSAAVSDAGMGSPVALQTGVADMNLRLWSPATGWRSADAAATDAASAANPNTAAPSGLEVTLRLSGNENGLVKVMLLGAI